MMPGHPAVETIHLSLFPAHPLLANQILWVSHVPFYINKMFFSSPKQIYQGIKIRLTATFPSAVHVLQT